jgi:hypothetical protein
MAPIHFYDIKGNEVPLFPLRYMKYVFTCSRAGIIRKEDRGQLPPANWKTPNGNRLYSIEDLALTEYVYKEIYPHRQGVKVPDWVKDLIAAVFVETKRVILTHGKSIDAEDWKELHSEYKSFNKFRAQLYIESWRRRLLDVNKFFPELVDEDD